MESTEPMVTFRKFYGRHHSLDNRYEICVTNDHGYATFVLITIRSCPRSSLITGFATRVVGQELLHPSGAPGIVLGFVFLDI